MLPSSGVAGSAVIRRPSGSTAEVIQIERGGDVGWARRAELPQSPSVSVQIVEKGLLLVVRGVSEEDPNARSAD